MADKLTRNNASEIRGKRDPSDLSDMDEPLYDEIVNAVVEPQAATRPPRALLRPKPQRPLPRIRNEVPMSLSKYTKHLLAVTTEKFIEQTVNPGSGSFENRNINRDLFLVDCLQQNDNNIKATCKTIFDTMNGARVPKATVHAAIDALCYNVLKQAMFGVWLDYNRSLRVMEGLMPDAFFEQLLNRRPAPENNEVDGGDIVPGLIDQREEQDSSPPGLDSNYVEIGGFTWQIEDENEGPLSKRIAEGLEDMRLHLENICEGYGIKREGGQRLPFFIEQIRGDWVRHDGTVYDAILAYDAKMADRNRQRALAEEVFYDQQAKRKLQAA